MRLVMRFGVLSALAILAWPRALPAAEMAKLRYGHGDQDRPDHAVQRPGVGVWCARQG